MTSYKNIYNLSTYDKAIMLHQEYKTETTAAARTIASKVSHAQNRPAVTVFCLV